MGLLLSLGFAIIIYLLTQLYQYLPCRTPDPLLAIQGIHRNSERACMVHISTPQPLSLVCGLLDACSPSNLSVVTFSFPMCGLFNNPSFSLVFQVQFVYPSMIPAAHLPLLLLQRCRAGSSTPFPPRTDISSEFLSARGHILTASPHQIPLAQIT